MTPQRPAHLFGYLPPIVDAPSPSGCDGDCPPWWGVLVLHVPVGGCTPFPVMMRFRWHLSHTPEVMAGFPVDRYLSGVPH